MALRRSGTTALTTRGRTASSPAIISRPTTPRAGTVQNNVEWGDIGDAIIEGAVNIGLDWVDRRVRGGSTPNVVPGTGNNTVPGKDLVGSGTTTSSCPDGSFRVPGFGCVDLIPGGNVSDGGMVLSTGEAVMGRYGAALVPMVREQRTARCPRGAVLGNDGLCYNKSQLRKSDRKWIPPRKPLLTGGDLNAISRASRAANRMKVQQKRLEKLGLLKKPKRGGSGGSRGVITKAEAARALRK